MGIDLWRCTNDFPNNGPHFDGRLINHPQLGSRIIEFDEVHHFTPHRMKTIQLFDEEVQLLPKFKM